MRLTDWQGRLTEYLNATTQRRFRPGRHDCALFVAGAVKAMTGVDHAKGWRGYTSLKAGQAALQEAGFADHVALVAAHYPEIPVAFARMGDVAVCEGDALGIVTGEMVTVLRPDGRGLIPLMEAKKVFQV